MGFRDGFLTAHHLPLREGIDGVDVVETLARLGVALMHRVDPQVAGLAAPDRACAAPAPRASQLRFGGSTG